MKDIGGFIAISIFVVLILGLPLLLWYYDQGGKEVEKQEILTQITEDFTVAQITAMVEERMSGVSDTSEAYEAYWIVLHALSEKEYKEFSVEVNVQSYLSR